MAHCSNDISGILNKVTMLNPEKVVAKNYLSHILYLTLDISNPKHFQLAPCTLGLINIASLQPINFPSIKEHIQLSNAFDAEKRIELVHVKPQHTYSAVVRIGFSTKAISMNTIEACFTANNNR